MLSRYVQMHAQRMGSCQDNHRWEHWIISHSLTDNITEVLFRASGRKWLPEDRRAYKEWLGGVVEHVEKNPIELHPVLEEFKTLIETNTRIYMLIQSMFEQVPNEKPYDTDLMGHKQIRDYEHMLQVLNHIITTAPKWNDRAYSIGMLAAPMTILFDWSMGTPSGYACFLDPEVNAMLKKVLDAWGDFLRSEASAEQTLTGDADGWFGAHSKDVLTAAANGAAGTAHTFEELFECNSTEPHYGFASWDAFFTRAFRPGVRLVAAPDNDAVIANACESCPCHVARDVALRTTFWVKGSPYSVLDMLGHDERAPLFAGGTVYQAFLSPVSYHRWHAPVSGRIVRAFVEPGTYFSELKVGHVGSLANWKDPEGYPFIASDEALSQVYLTAVATRAIIFIEADNPKIGLIAFLGVGMMEVSTCEIAVREGEHVTKGDEIGMFHFGGSSHCVLFRKGIDVQGFPEPGREKNVPVRGLLAVVRG